MNLSSNPMGSDRREEYRDFAERYEQGAPPYDDISDEETLDLYHEIVAELSEEDYQNSAREAFSRMSPEERVEFGRQLRDQSTQQGLDSPGRSPEAQVERFEDSDLLAQVTARANREHSDLLEGLLKGGGAGFVGGALGDGVTGGEGASGGEGGMTSNPAVKAAMVGIAAAVVKREIDGG
jgi:hypothetical protein